MNKELCCPEFNPAEWDNKMNEWSQKPFLKDDVKQIFHFPLNISTVIKRMYEKGKKADVMPENKDFLILAYDPSPWKSELYMTITKDMEGESIERMSGKFYSKVFDGPYSDIPKFVKEMDEWANKEGKKIKKQYFHYAYCPGCAKEYGHNYIVAFAELEE